MRQICENLVPIHRIHMYNTPIGIPTKEIAKPGAVPTSAGASTLICYSQEQQQ